MPILVWSRLYYFFFFFGLLVWSRLYFFFFLVMVGDKSGDLCSFLAL